MANFEQAFNKTMEFEGFYSHDPVDPGSETYRGISRRSHPDWPGWARIDQVKIEPGFPAIVAYLDLDEQVKKIYRENYWEKIKGDVVPNQIIANKLFCFAVNAGNKKAIELLQISLNTLNPSCYNRKSWPTLVVDGMIGPKTLQAIAACVALYRYETLLAFLFSSKIVNYYCDLVESNTKLEKFIVGWIRRALIS